MNKAFRLEALRWFGLIGLTLTIIEKLEPLLSLAKLVRLAIAKWKELSHLFWSSIFAFFSVEVSKETATALSVFALIFVMTLRSDLSEIKIHPILAFMLGIINVFSVFVLVAILIYFQADKDVPYYKFIIPDQDTPVGKIVYDPDHPERNKILMDYWRTNWDAILGGTLIAVTPVYCFSTNQAAFSLNLLRMLLLLLILLSLNYVALHAGEIRAFFG